MRRRRYMQRRTLRCPNCGAITFASKLKRKTPEGHLKTMECWKCRQEVDFIQIDSDCIKVY